MSTLDAIIYIVYSAAAPLADESRLGKLIFLGYADDSGSFDC